MAAIANTHPACIPGCRDATTGLRNCRTNEPVLSDRWYKRLQRYKDACALSKYAGRLMIALIKPDK